MRPAPAVLCFECSHGQAGSLSPPRDVGYGNAPVDHSSSYTAAYWQRSRMLNVDRSRDNAAFASARMKIDEIALFRDSGIVTSTAFVKLKHPELAPVLKQVLQNSPFIGDHGVPYHCEMEVAIYQRTPKERAKEDPYVATYEQGVFTCVRMNQLFTHTLGCLRRIAG